jgi:polysaccharide deacetylase 2 family uncharacterized protein YibQ
MAKRKKSAKAKAARAPGRARSMPRGGGFLHVLRSLAALLPSGVTLFAIGIALGFGIGVALMELAPPLLNRLQHQDQAPVVARKAESPTAAQLAERGPDIVEAPAPSPPPPPSPPKLPSAGEAVPAIAEESAHQSAQIMTPPPAEPMPEAAQVAALPAAPPGQTDLPLWLQNAAAARNPGNLPMIAVILDDVGVAPQHAEMAIDLPAPIVLSIMTYAENAADLSRKAQAKGHEIMVHMPMQPVDSAINPGPNALLVGMDPAEIQRRVAWGLDRLTGYVGFNNHMGSRFTQDAEGMRIVLAEAKNRGLLFLDSKTIAGSVGDSLAAEMGVVHIARDVFLDDQISEAGVARQLSETETIARKQGYAVAIGHPHPATIAVLKRWLVDARERGFAIVPLTTIIKKREGVAG